MTRDFDFVKRFSDRLCNSLSLHSMNSSGSECGSSHLRSGSFWVEITVFVVSLVEILFLLTDFRGLQRDGTQQVETIDGAAPRSDSGLR
jgi:hypothetical protein